MREICLSGSMSGVAYQLLAPSSGGQTSQEQGARSAPLNPDMISLAVLPFKATKAAADSLFVCGRNI